jgi:hypothetical protein
VDVAGRPVDVCHVLVPERDEVFDDRPDTRAVIVGDEGKRAIAVWQSNGHGRKPELLEEFEAIVIGPEIGEQHAVDVAFLGKPPVTPCLRIRVAPGDLEEKGVAARGESAFNPGKEVREEGIGREQFGGPRHHESQGERTPV